MREDNRNRSKIPQGRMAVVLLILAIIAVPAVALGTDLTLNTTEPTAGVPLELPESAGTASTTTPEQSPTEAAGVTPAATEPLPQDIGIAADTADLGATMVIPSNSNVLLQISNDGTARFNDYGNNTYHFFSPGQSGTQGINALHITTSPAESSGQVTFSSNQSGIFYLTDTGGRGYDDNGILLLAVNGTIPDSFRVTVKASGYQWTPVLKNTYPTFDNVTYVPEALNETFTKDDFLYGPQTWRPCPGANYPIFDGQDMTDTENTFSILFIDLNAGILGANTLSQPSFAGQSVTDNGAIKVEYAFENLPTFAAFDAYAYTVSSNQDQGIRWTNSLSAADSSGYAVIGQPLPEPPTADFTANVSRMETPLAVAFTGASTDLSSTGGVITATDDVFLTVANDAGVLFNDFGNNTFHILWTGGGLNALHISNGSSSTIYGEATTTSAQSGTFYVTTTGGRGYQDDIFLCVAVNGTIPDEFRLHLVATGCQWTPCTTPRTIPPSSAITYNATTLDEWFTKDDLIYGPQTWRPAVKRTYPLHFGQNVSDTSNQFRMMFVDLNGGILSEYPLKVQYEFQNMNTSASFNVYGYAQYPDKDKPRYVNSWTNCLTSDSDISGWYVLGVPLEPPARVNISSSDIKLPINGKKTFTATAYDVYDKVVDGAVFSWTSSNTTVGTIDQNGLFTPKALGETEINVTCTGGASDSVHVTVVPAVSIVLDTIVLSPSSLDLYSDDTRPYRLTATGYDQFGDVYPVDAYTWSSTNETVCTVNATGFVSLIGAGNATITARNGSVSGTAPVTISDRPDWTLDLIGAVNQTLNRTEFIDLAKAHPATYTDNKGYVWEGVDLSVLIGLVDDTDPATLNQVLANDLYRIFVTSSQFGEDNCSVVTSDELLGDKTFVLGYKLNSEEIPDKTVGGKIYWPLRMHGSGCAVNSRSLAQVTKIEFAIRPHVSKINISEMIQAWDNDSAPISIPIHAYDDSGTVISDTKYVLDYAWTSSNESVGVVDGSGNFTVRGAGRTQITAQLGDKTTTIDAVVYASAENSHLFSVDETGATGFKTIPDALKFAQDGDVIVVKNGTYTGALTIDKAITIRSENGASGVIIPAAVNINADNVSLEGLTINNQVNVKSEYCVIDHCVIDYGVKNSGVLYLYSGSSNCTISNSTVINTISYGIDVCSSSDNLIVNNSVEAPSTGIIVWESGTYSERNVIKDNDLQGSISISASDTIVENNTITSTSKGYPFSGSSCQNVTVVNNTMVANGKYGMFLWSVTGSKFCNNRISGGTTATIYAHTSVSSDAIYQNEISGTAGKLIYAKSTTTLNSVDPVTYVYNNNTYTGIIGNYYSAYAGEDGDGDGIGDTPYTGTKITDSYPLVAPITGYQILESAPKVIVAPASATLDVDESMNFTVNVYDADGVLMSGAVPVWSSSNTTVGVVDAATGFFEALSAGTTTVTATAEGVTSLAHVTVTLPDVPVANFTAMPLSGDAPLAVQFTDTSTGSITSRSWDFDNDGVIDSTEQNATHTYTAAGNYTVNLTVANAAGSNTTVKTDYITVSSGSSGGDAPVANFTANVTSGDAPLTVAFTDTSSGSPTAWTWDFENNGVVDSYEQNPAHTYTAAGTYTVNLTVENNGGSDSAVRTDYITVTGSTGPSVLLDYNNIFVKVANDRGVKYNAFGNNTYNIRFEGYDRGLNALHISTDPASNYGQVTVSENQSGTFYATDSGGKGYEDEIILMVAVNGTIPDDFRLRITADGYTWTPNPASNQPPSLDSVTYQASSLDEVFTKDDFIYGPQIWKPTGNGFDYPIYAGQNMSDTENTFHLLFIDLNAGVLRPNTDLENRGAVRINYAFENLETFAAFNVYAYCQNSNNGDNMVAWSNAVLAPKAMSGYSVTGVPYTPPSAPVADFTATPLSGEAPLTVAFTDTSSGSPTSWAWDFENDGVIDSIEQNPVHTYTVPGTYTVNLTIENDGGSDSEIKTDYITATESTGPSGPRTWTVGASGCDFVTLADALGSSSVIEGDTVFVYNGTYAVSGAIKPVSITGEGAEIVTLDLGGNTMRISGDGTIVERVRFTNGLLYFSSSGGVSVPPTNTIVRNCIFENMKNPGTAAGAVYLGLTNNTLIDNTFRNNNVYNLIYIASGTGSRIENNTFTNTTSTATLRGVIRMAACGDAIICNNSFSDNAMPCILIQSMIKTGNKIYLNDFVVPDGINPVKIQGTNAAAAFPWVTPQEIAYTYQGSSYTKVLGNYWNTYNGTDADGDGIGDTSYSLVTNQIDEAPLMSSVQTYFGQSTSPIANFTANVTSGDAPLAVLFTDASTRSPTSWAWDFENDGVIDSIEQNPVHTYTAPGTYTVNLTVTNDAGSSSATTSITVAKPQIPEPVAGFAANVTSGDVPLVVRFTDTSTDATSWLWTFGDGATSTEQNPVHTYTQVGRFTVTLTVANAAGSSSATGVVTTRDIPPAPPQAAENFTLGDDAVTAGAGGQQVTFNATAGTGNVTTDGNDILLQTGGLTVTIKTEGLIDNASTGNVTGNVTGVHLESAPVNATVGSAGNVSVSFAAEMDNYDPALGITTTIYDQPGDATKTAFVLAAQEDEGSEIAGIAYAVYFNKTTPTDTIRDAVLRLTVSPDWVDRNGGVDAIRIFRLGDDGNRSVLQTTYAGTENGMMVFTAVSPEGFSAFALGAVAGPASAPVSSGSSSSGSSTAVGAASNLKAGESATLAMRMTAVSAVTVTTNNAVKDVMVTVASGTLPQAAKPPAGTLYQYVQTTLYKAAEDDLAAVQLRFAVPAAWLAEHGCTAGQIALLRHTADGWQEVPVEALGDEDGNAVFTASPDAFGLFAIAATGEVPGMTGDATPGPTAAETPAGTATTAPPADTTPATPQATPLPVWAAILAFGILLLVRRT